MNNLIRHAVITDTGIAIVVERKVVHLSLHDDIGNIADAWAVGQQMGISHFWVMPESHFDIDGSAVFEISEDYSVFVMYEDDKTKERPMFARCWKRDTSGSHQIYIGYAFRGRFAWDVKGPVDILATIDYIRRLTGMNVAWSPAYMGIEMLTGMFSGTKTLQERVKNPDTDLHSIPAFEETSARDLSWKHGDLKNILRDGLYLHCIDRNSAYLAAMRTVQLGIGEARYVDSYHTPTGAGIYHVKYAVGHSEFDGLSLPCIVADRQKWVTQDILAYMMEQGYHVEILEAWVFDKSLSLLANFANKIWGYRDTFNTDIVSYPYEPARLNAYRTMKALATGVGGRFNSTDSKTFRHANWWWDIVGFNRRTILSFIKMMSVKGCIPIVAYADNLIFLSAESDINKALAPALVKQHQLGGFKVQYTVQVCNHVIEELIAGSPSKIIGYLKKQAKHEEMQSYAQ
jgi:hypothetical protein